MADDKQLTVTFELVGDEFPHAWFFNRFRVEKVGESTLVSFGLATEVGGIPEINAVVLSESDLDNNRERGTTFLGRVGDIPPKTTTALGFAVPPKRVYPVNHVTLSRANFLSEIGFYRFSVNTLVDRLKELREKPAAKAVLRCYPVVMFRCDLDVQVALVKELFARR